MSHERRRQDRPGAIRLTFTNDDGELELVDARRLSVRVPAGEQTPTDGNDDRIGGWVEVQSAEGDVLYRRRMRPVAEDAEVSDGGGSFRRVPHRASRLVSVLVPDLEGARQVVLRERRGGDKQRERSDLIDHASVSLEQIEGYDSLDHDTHGSDENSRPSEER